MKREKQATAATPRRRVMIRPLCLLTVLLGILAGTPMDVLAAENRCDVSISIVGQLLDEAEEPLAAYDLSFGFNMGEAGEAGTKKVTTDENGMFELTVNMRQSFYIESSLSAYCAELQGYILFDGDTRYMDFTPGRQESSQPGQRDRWADGGRYQDGYIQLFRSLRIGESEEGETGFEEAGFEDMEILLGTDFEPCVFQLHRAFTVTERFADLQDHDLKPYTAAYDVEGRTVFTGDPPQSLESGDRTYLYAGWTMDEGTNVNLIQEPPIIDVKENHQIRYVYRGDETVVTVNHINTVTGAPEQEQESLVVEEGAAEWQVDAIEIQDMAPIAVELDGERVAEAEKERPITSYTLETRPGSVELTFYYHPDRDSDGIPDHLVTERHRLENGEPIAGHEGQQSIYAHKEVYRGQALSAKGYQYQGYTSAGGGENAAGAGSTESTGNTGNGPLQSGYPEDIITKDRVYTYIYTKETTEESGGGGKPEPKPEEPKPEEPQPPEPLEPDLPDEEKPPEAPDPLPEEPLPDQGAEGEPAEEQRPQPESAKQAPLPLTEEEREALRNVTFVKRGNQMEAAPGELVSYTFTGFENAYPYPVNGFAIIDRPDKGLDFQSITMPAFQNGSGVSYEVAFTTSVNGERKLVENYPADWPLVLEAPDLREGEHITAVIVRMGEVPAGFGTGDEVTVSFRIWEDPPDSTLHNKGTLFYEETGEAVECESDEDASTMWVKLTDHFGSGGWTGGVTNEMVGAQNGSGQKQMPWKYGAWASLTGIFGLALHYQKKFFSRS